MTMYKGVGWVTTEVDWRESSGISAILPDAKFKTPDAKFKTVEIFVSRLKPDTRIVYLKKWFWGKFQNARSVRFQALRTRYDTYASLKISAKLLDEGDISDVLNCWKCPQELVLECHKCPLVTRFEPRSWQPNRCLVPPTSSGNEQKWKGY